MGTWWRRAPAHLGRRLHLHRELLEHFASLPQSVGATVNPPAAWQRRNIMDRLTAEPDARQTMPSDPANFAADRPGTLLTVAGYLFGEREAILRLAQNRHALPIAAIFTLFAGLAREYDGVDLLREPWHLAVPAAVSLVTSFALYCSVRLIGWRRDLASPGFLADYRSFLGLFWMTAPLAWLYAIPCERFLAPGNAVRFNLMLLGVVAIWRVLLITRVIIVVYGARPTVDAFAIVMLFADIVMLLALHFAPLPLLQVMGGVRLSEGETVLLKTALIMSFMSLLSLPIWIIGTLRALRTNPRWTRPQRTANDRGATSGTWLAAIGSICVWAVVLPFTQPEQTLKSEVENLLTSARISEGLRLMSDHSRDDFPPHWDPPPRVGFGGHNPPIVEVAAIIARDPVVDWARAIFLAKFRARALHLFGLYLWVDEAQVEPYLAVLEQLPENDWRGGEFESALRVSQQDEGNSFSPAFHQRLAELLERTPDHSSRE